MIDVKEFIEKRGIDEKQFFTGIAVQMYANRTFTFEDAMAFATIDEQEMQLVCGLYNVPIRWEEYLKDKIPAKRRAGGATVYHMADDFDAPLEDFKDYM
jgi:hypothetical protein